VATSFGSFHEFWAALTQLYESTLRLEENQKYSDARVDRLTSQVPTLAGTVAQLVTIWSLTNGDFRAWQGTEAEWAGLKMISPNMREGAMNA
jgi:hypothetical protein